MANLAQAGPLWSFTTAGAPPPNPPPPPPDTTAPGVYLYSPGHRSTVSGVTTISASSWDNVGVAGVQFKVDGIPLGPEDRTAPYTISWDTMAAAAGAHTLTAEARDSAGNRRTSLPIFVTVANDTTPDTTAPAVSLTSPLNGSTVGGTSTVAASASDNIGVVGVRFQIDNSSLGAEDTTSPYSVSWNTTASTNGTHTVKAFARDAAGNTGVATITVTVANPDVQPTGTIVLHAAQVPDSRIVGNWVKVVDSTAADGIALRNTDKGAPKIAPALITPQHYFETTFNATAGTAYHLWIRMRAQNDYFGNDSIHVQFSDAVNTIGTPIYRIGAAGAENSAQVVLQESDGGIISGWGWADQGWNGPGPLIYFSTTGPHTLRIQQREDGAIVDQIVLSPDTYVNVPPGAQTQDHTIVPR
jgi:hypothetical protein